MKETFQRKILAPLRGLANADFWRAFFPLVIPITLQQMLISSLNLVDTLMVGRLGDNAIASVGVAGQLSFFMNIVLFGVASGGAVFIAQYHGANDVKNIRRTFGMVLCINVPLALCICGICFFAPERIASIFTDEEAMIREAAQYLEIACFAYIGVSLSQTMSVVLRSTEKVRLPMFASMASAILNAIVNYILIFGKLGFPAMGVRGAALATVISSFVNVGVLLTVSLIQKNILIAPLREIFSLSRDFVRRFIGRAAPVLVNEGLWSMGVLGYNMVYGRMGQENYAALTICRTVEDLAFIFFVGICNACNIMIGKRIGAGDLEESRDYARRFMLLMPLISITVGLCIILGRPAILSLFSVSAGVRETAAVIMLIYALEIGFRNIPYIAVVGVFRAGGDTRAGVRYDGLCLYCIGLPVVIVTGLFLKLPFVLVYLLMLLCEDVPKCILCLRHFHSMKWIQPITNK